MAKAPRIFLDTNTIIYFLKGVDGFEALARFKFFYYSFISRIELFSFGGEQEDKLISDFLRNGKQININKKIIDRTIEIRKNYQLKLPDAVIVASAQHVGADLYTSDQEILHKIDFLTTINLLQE
jgi:hypothetical protein